VVIVTLPYSIDRVWQSQYESDRQKMVDINPGTGVYAMFPSFNYKLWGAIGEFVDNSVSSYLANQDRLKLVEGDSFQLLVHIDYSESDNSLVIRDNAAGISEADYERAFRLAIPPSDLSHIGQYGVGMKAAACWFAKSWSVTSSALGESVCRRVDWDTSAIVESNINTIEPSISSALKEEHYTVLRMTDLYRSIRGQSTNKVKSYIAGIYREFIRSGEVQVFFNGERLNPPDFPILSARKWNEPDGPEIEWSRDFLLDLSETVQVRGRAYLLATMKRPETALNLFWHRRLIRGNADPNYRPTEIFGPINSFESGRLCIDLHLDAFQPTVEKQDFLFERNGISEEDLLIALRAELSRDEFDILGQAKNFRSGKLEDRSSVEDLVRAVVESASKPISETVISPVDPSPASPYPPTQSTHKSVAEQRFSFAVGDCPWELTFRINDDPAPSQMIEITEVHRQDETQPERLAVTISYSHPFIKRYWSEDTQQLIVAFAVALGFGEVAARRGGATLPSFVRTNMDQILRKFVTQEFVESSRI